MTELNRLIIKRPGNLLSVITDRELTEEQTKLVELFIDLIVDATPLELEEIELIWAHGVDEGITTSMKHRLEGIEQYQAESR